ncbi:cyclic di-GMP phosphodiesterase Gmr [mine drainage metagenome]|uniref:Cyclic di-GMP phosphodiesterase Gmr n=1 Tax=mine drainage metagenome TaxID=410659 RepID=A0A1J5S2B5_9ZZZZ
MTAPKDDSFPRGSESLLGPLLSPMIGSAAFLGAGALWLAVGRRLPETPLPWGALGGATALVYAALALKRRRRRPAPTLDDLPEAAFLLDGDGLLQAWNRTAEDWVGDSLFERGQAFTQAVMMEAQPALADALTQATRSGRAAFETRLAGADGLSVPCQGQARLLDKGRGLLLTLRRRQADPHSTETDDSFRRMADLSSCLLAILVDGRIRWINRAGAMLLGAETPTQLMGLAWAALHLPAQDDRLARLCRLDGLETEAAITYGASLHGEHPATLVEALDLSGLSSGAQELEQTQRRLRALMEAVDDAVVVIDQDGAIEAMNGMAESLFGHAAPELVGSDIWLLMPPDHCERFLTAFKKRVTGGETGLRRRYDIRGQRRDGTTFPAQMTLAEGRGGPHRLFTLVIRDLSERKALYSRLSMTEKVLEATSEGVILADLKGRILWVNTGFTRISGYSRDEAIGQTTNLLKSGLQSPSFYKSMWGELSKTGEWAGEIWNRRKDGEAYPEWLSIKTIYDELGQPERFIGVFSDISKHKRAQETIRHLTYYDAVTRLPNRYLFQDRFNQSLERAKRANRQVALVLVSLDRFKTINETLGHQTGDALLRDVAQRLTNSVRGEDTVSRLRGDTFCCILAELGQTHDANPVINRILDAFSLPFQIGGHELFITASLGISLFPLDGGEMDDLLQKAESAVNRSKERAENSYYFYTPEMNANSMERLRLETDLRKAINRGELVLYYQPKVDARSGRLVGAEALVRWHHPEYGMVPPGRFIPIAEDTGLILPIGASVMKQACQQIQDWMAHGLTPVPVAVNLSAHQFRQPDMVQSVTRILDDYRVPQGLIELELTESAVMRNADSAIDVLMELHHMGLSIAIDDFGTGYSSFSYLKRFPIDRLKIDRSFVQDLGRDQTGEEIVGAIIAMAHSLKMSVIAEGVESAQQLDMLRDMGCEEIQGFYYSRPVPAAEFARFLQAGELSGRDDITP